MTTLTTTYSIQQVADLTGLTVHTLRYYERIDVIPHIERDENGYRHYSQNDIGRIRFICCLIRTKMPLDQVRRYAELYAYGAESNDERFEILNAHREEIARQIESLNDTLALVDYKLTHLHPEHEQHPTLEKVEA